MKKIRRKLLAAVLTVAVVMSLIPMSALAATPVAEVWVEGGQHYTENSLEAAWNRAMKYTKEETYIRLLRDADTASKLSMQSSRNLTLYLDGNVINRHKANAENSTSKNTSVIEVGSNCKLTIEGGTTSTVHNGYLDKDLWFQHDTVKSVKMYGGMIVGGANSGYGGAILVSGSGSTVSVKDVTFAGNLASNGAAIGLNKNKTALVLDSCTFMYNHANDYGGAIGNNDTGNSITMNGCTISNNSADYGGGIYDDDGNVSIVVNNSTIKENTVSDNGGGVYLNEEDSRLTMKNSHIDSNTAAKYGGGICTNDDNVVISLDANSTISKNTAKKNDGGGIYLDGEKSSVRGGSISENTAGSHGGGIYLNNDDSSVNGTVLSDNTAVKDGGAIYLQEENCTISGCTISGNTARNGGGILDYNGDNTLSGTSITGNRASGLGAGFYMDPSADESGWSIINLSGKMIIKDNTTTYGSTSNMTLAGKGIIGSMPNANSMVGITPIRNQEYWQLSYQKGTYDERPFFSDDNQYSVKYISDKNDKYNQYLVIRHIPQQKIVPVVNKVSANQASALEKTSYTYQAGQQEFPVYKTFFKYANAVDGSADNSALCYYTDGYFFNDPKTYDTHLASMSISMAMSGFGASANGTSDYSNKFSHAKQLMSNLGIADENIYVNDSYTQKPDSNSIGVIIGSKTLQNANAEDTDYTLVPVIIRSSNYESEWAGNLNVGTTGEHQGFKIAADTALEEVNNYIQEYGLSDQVNAGKVKFWVVGYSRGGATANLLSKRLIDAYQNSGNDIFGYTFATPRGAVQSEIQSDVDYTTIHNTVNPSDFVPYVGPTEMGFTRYGVDHYVPGTPASNVKVKNWYFGTSDSSGFADNNEIVPVYEDNSLVSGSYADQKEKMLKQFDGVTRDFVFNDYFHLAAVDVYSNLGGVDTTGDDEVSLNEWLQDFYHYFQKWAIGSRADYSANETLNQSTYGMTFEEALEDAVYMVYHLDDDAMNSIMDSASNLSLGLWDTLSIFSAVAWNYDSLTISDRQTYKDKIWNIVDETHAFDALSVSEKNRLKKDYNVIMDVLFRFAHEDYQHRESGYEDGTVVAYNSGGGDGGTDWFIQAGTLLYNMSNMVMNHYPEVNFSWIRSYDSYYNNETAMYAIQSPETVAAPKATIAGDKISSKAYNGEQAVSLSADKGSAIYYTLQADNGEETEVQLYQKSLVLTPKDGQDTTTYTIKTYSVWYDKKSESKTYEVTVKAVPKYNVTVNGNVIGSYAEGDLVTVDANTSEDQVFDAWSEVTGITLSDAETSQSQVSFKMPAENVSLKASYVDKVKNLVIEIDPKTGQAYTIIEINGVKQKYYLNMRYSGTEDTKSDDSRARTLLSDPAADPVQTASITAQATLLPSEQNDIYFSKDVEATMAVEGTDIQDVCDVDYSNADGSVTVSNTFDNITVSDDMNAKQLVTVTVECYDLNNQKVDSTYTYQIEKGQTRSIVAPAVTDEKFYAWEEPGSMNGLTSASISGRQITVNADKDIKIRANYIPVVKEIDLTMPELKAGQALPKAITKCDVTVSNTYDMTKAIVLNWDRNDDAVLYDTIYTAKLTLDTSALTQFKLLFDVSQDLVVKVNGQQVSPESLKRNADSTKVSLYYSYPAISGTYSAALTTVEQPQDLMLAYGADLKLPETVNISVADKSVTSAPVVWDSADYVKGNLTDQNFTVHGKVQYDCNPDGVSTDVAIHVFAAGAQKVALPTASLDAGSYDVARSVTLDCDTEEAVLYYTTDGTEPTVNSTLYTEPIVISKTTTLRVLAVKDGMQPVTASYTYNMDNVTDENLTAPSVKEGGNASWKIGSADGLRFVSDAQYIDFLYVMVDGVTIDPSLYTVEDDDNTIVTLSQEYLATLAQGQHTLSICSYNGNAETVFAVTTTDAANPDNSGNADNAGTQSPAGGQNTGTNPAAPSDKGNVADTTANSNAKAKTAKTGDNTPIAATATVMVLALAGVVTVLAVRRKREAK